MLPPTQLYLVSIRYRRKISLLRLLLFLIDLKSTILKSTLIVYKYILYTQTWFNLEKNRGRSRNIHQGQIPILERAEIFTSGAELRSKAVKMFCPLPLKILPWGLTHKRGQGQNIFFHQGQIFHPWSGAYLKGGHMPPDLIHKGHIPFMPHGFKKLSLWRIGKENNPQRPQIYFEKSISHHFRLDNTWFLSLWTFTVGEIIIGAPKIRNNYGAIQLFIFQILR